MVVQLLMGVLADLVFGSAASMRRSFGEELDHYLQHHGARRAEDKPARPR